MRGLAFCGDGVLTDAGGAAWRVKHADGGKTFAEGQEPDAKEVPTERPPLSFIPSSPAYTCSEILKPPRSRCAWWSWRRSQWCGPRAGLSRGWRAAG
jgi:hypothetical protein